MSNDILLDPLFVEALFYYNFILTNIVSLTEQTNQNGKRYYDYSNMFGVNTNICKVYCSDKVTYYMAPKKDVYSGLQLKYDIEIINKAITITV